MRTLGIGMAGALLLTAAAAAGAPASDWVSGGQSQVRLIAADQAVGETGTVSLGVQFRLEPGWKLYWRTPGDAGVPPQPDWSGSQNVEAVDVRWPLPKRFTAEGLDSFGYTDEVVLPVTVMAQPGRPLVARLQLAYGICEAVCIPLDAELELRLPAAAEGPSGPSVFAPLIARYADRVPAAGDAAADLAAVRIAGAAAAPTLEVVMRRQQPFTAPDLLLEGPRGTPAAAPAVALADGGRQATFRWPLSGRAAAALRGAPLTLTLADAGGALEYHGSVAAE